MKPVEWAIAISDHPQSTAEQAAAIVHEQLRQPTKPQELTKPALKVVEGVLQLGEGEVI